MKNTERSNKTDQIIALEWPMFHAVNGSAAKADCQNDQRTFEGMRRAQFSAWSGEALSAYLEDLRTAAFQDRNLAEEKYIHMMEKTAPESYAVLSERCARPGNAAYALVNKIVSKLLQETAQLFESYPHLSGKGRPLTSDSDGSGTVSVETYIRGELLTYSEKTLTALYNHILDLEKCGKSYSYLALEGSARHYGYTSLDEAETAMKEQAKAGPEGGF